MSVLIWVQTVCNDKVPKVPLTFSLLVSTADTLEKSVEPDLA